MNHDVSDREHWGVGGCIENWSLRSESFKFGNDGGGGDGGEEAEEAGRVDYTIVY